MGLQSQINRFSKNSLIKKIFKHQHTNKIKRGVQMIELTKKPKGVTVIEGFPGLGVVSTITTSYLLENLEMEQIGKHYFEEKEVAPIISIHKCKLIDPVSVHYSKKYNLVLIHAITSPLYIEWKAANLVLNICNQLKAKELISIEGIAAPPTTAKKQDNNIYYFTRNKAIEQNLMNLGITCLGEGSIMGVTAALLEKSTLPTTAIFADIHSNLPDSRAAAKIIEFLDKYIGLSINYKPLIKQAEEFEKAIKGMFKQAAQAQEVKEKKDLSYFG